MRDVNWWMDASCRWHQGLPPPGWWQAHNGRWHPPADDTTAEMALGPPGGGAHLATGGRRTDLWGTYRRWPRWARLAVPVAASILIIGVLGAAATGGLREGDPNTTATEGADTDPESTTTVPNGEIPAPTATNTVAAPTSASVPGTTIPAGTEPAPTTIPGVPAPPPPTTPDPTNNDIHPGARCSPEGATALSADGVPMICTTQKCHGAPYRQPQWRRTAC
jgi:hypothetical protein